jgi:hypothetical protein
MQDRALISEEIDVNAKEMFSFEQFQEMVFTMKKFDDMFKA